MKNHMSSRPGSRYTIIVGVFLSSLSSLAQERSYSESLQEALAKARTASGALKSAQATAVAASEGARSAKSALFPRLTLEGSYFYQTNVPEREIFPGGPEILFGTHKNYSVGPVLTYSLWEGGAASSQSKAAGIIAQAKGQDAKARARELEDALSRIYFRAQYALKSLELTANSLNLAKAQKREIELRVQAGAASNLDQATAQRQYLSYILRFKQAQNELSAILTDLYSMTNQLTQFDLARPISSALKGKLPKEVDEPTLVVKLDGLEESLKIFRSALKTRQQPSKSHPQIQSLALAAEASTYSAQAKQGALWPRILLQAKSQYLYPNLVVPETAWNNVFAVSLSLPVFEAGLNRAQAAQKRSEALALESLESQRLQDLRRDFEKANHSLASLDVQVKLAGEGAEEAERVAKLTFAAYRSGKVNYTEVQTANLQLLEANVAKARIEQEILMQLATVRFLAPEYVSLPLGRSESKRKESL